MHNSGHKLQSKTPSKIKFSGEITWESVQNLMEKKALELEEIVSNLDVSLSTDPNQIILDLSEVTKVDMCALALVLEIEKKIKILSKGKPILSLLWQNVPSDLISLADLSGLTDYLEFK